MASEKTTRRLGRGLDALLRGSTNRAPEPEEAQSDLRNIKVTEIRNNPYQPRKKFTNSELKELQESIRANGLLQPITVRRAGKGDGYELIAGERRLRAVTGLGWKDVPAIIREVDDKSLLTYALIENLQRSDLDPIEEAEGYQQLVKQFGLTQQEVADIVGKDRATVANSLRVLNLPQAVREMLRDGKLSLGHAKVLLSLDSAEKIVALAREITTRGLTVRDLERRLKTEPSATRKAGKRAKPAQKDAAVSALESELRRRFQTDAEILVQERGGTIAVRFYSDDDLRRVVELMGISLE